MIKGRLNLLKQKRIEKIKKLRELGVNPYPYSFSKTHTTAQASRSLGKKIRTAGRIMALRGHGKIIFADVADFAGKIQVWFQQSKLSKDFQIVKLLDVGDFIGVEGAVVKTKAGEITVDVDRFKLLSKSLRPLPDKWHGLKDVETKLRKRYLDLMMDPSVREIFVKKEVFWRTIRDFLNKDGFLEVETPVLEAVPGGAETRPFITHYNALDRDFYLRISLELPLKRLMVGGFEKVYEIGRIFRNEGMDAEHLQDYTQLEFYWAYADYRDLMKFLKKMYRLIVKSVLGTTKAVYKGVEVDWGKEWQKYDYYELFEEFAGLDLRVASDQDLRKKAKVLKIEYEKYAQRGRLIDLIYKKTVRPKLVEPGFLLNPPVEIEPLAKRDDKDPKRVQRLQILAWGTELGKGFSELNDPLDQRQRFEEQMKLRKAGDEEAQMIDEDYLEAMEYGMPPVGGFGMSERFFAFLMDRPIRETIIFPPTRKE